MNLKCIFAKNRPIDFSSLCSVVFTCIVHIDFTWVFLSPFSPLISVSTYQFQDASQLSLDVILNGILVDLVYLVVFTGERAQRPILAQLSVDLLRGLSQLEFSCWRASHCLPVSAECCCLRCPGNPRQGAWGPEYLGFPLRNSRISPESSDLREHCGPCQGTERCGRILPKTPRLKRWGLVFLLCAPRKILS